jgi:hypothetical protein
VKSSDSVSHAVFRDTICEMNHLFAESQEHHRTGFQTERHLHVVRARVLPPRGAAFPNFTVVIEQKDERYTTYIPAESKEHLLFPRPFGY